VRYSFKHTVAQLISYTLHPGILPTLGAIYVLHVLPNSYDQTTALKLVGTVFFGTYLAPLLGTVLLTWTGVISSIHLVHRKERIYPYIIGAASMIATSNLLSNAKAPIEMILCVLSASVVLLVSTILIPYFKSSAHMAGISGFVALYLGMHLRYQSGELPILLLLIAIMSAVAWARLSLKRHTLRELLSGTILGFSILFILLSK